LELAEFEHYGPAMITSFGRCKPQCFFGGTVCPICFTDQGGKLAAILYLPKVPPTVLERIRGLGMRVGSIVAGRRRQEGDDQKDHADQSHKDRHGRPG